MLFAAAHGSMNPCFVIHDGLHWCCLAMDAKKKIVYTVDPRGAWTAGLQRWSAAAVVALKPYGAWHVQNSRVKLQEKRDEQYGAIWTLHIVQMCAAFVAKMEDGAGAEHDS